MSRQQREENAPNPDHLSSEEQERIKNLSDEELRKELLQKLDGLGYSLTSARLNAMIDEVKLRSDKVEEKERNLPAPDHLSPEERERIKNLSDEELFEEMSQEADSLGECLTSARFDALVDESISRADKAEEKEGPILTENQALEFHFKLMDEIRQRRTQPPESRPGNTTTEHKHEGCPQRGKDPDITP